MARRLANLGLVLALLLALTPSLMRVTAQWEERRDAAAFLDSASPGKLEMPSAREPRGQMTPAVAGAPQRVAMLPTRTARRKSRTHAAAALRPVRQTAPSTTASTRRSWEPCLIEIPAIGVRSVVRPGVGNWRVIPGPAWEPASAAPGGPGNAVIAAHRNMWQQTFSRLPRVRAGQPVYIRTHTHRYKYVVLWSRQVSTRETDLLKNTRAPRLTLYTCVLPFDANRRWMVRAELADTWAVAPEPGGSSAREATREQPRTQPPSRRT